MDHADLRSWQELCTMLATTHVARPTRGCGFVDCEPGWLFSRVLTDHDLWAVVSGRGSASVAARSVAARSVTLQAGSVLLMRPGDRWLVRQDPADRLTVVYCHFDFFAADGSVNPMPADRLPSRHLRLSRRAAVTSDLQRVVTLVQDHHPSAPLHSAAALLAALLGIYREDAGADGGTGGGDERVQRVVHRIQREPGLRLPLDEAASSVGLSAVHFSRLFRRVAGRSYRDFVLENRLERARQLLTESPLPVGRIARMLGYQDAYLFSRQVRRRYGLSPTQLRGR